MRQASISDDLVPESVSLGALLVANWIGDPRYQDAEGKPAPLPRFTNEKDLPTFEELVTNVNKDIRPRVVLDEWLRLGICQIDKDDNVHLLEESFIPESGFEEKLFFLGKNVHDHLAASVHNMQATKTTFLERSVYYDELTREDTEVLAQLTRNMANEVLGDTNKKAMQLQKNSRKTGDANYRMNFGIYYFSERDVDPDQTSDT